MRNLVAILTILSVSSLTACTAAKAPEFAAQKGPKISSGEVPVGTGQGVDLGDGNQIVVHNLSGTLFLEVESVISDTKMALLQGNPADVDDEINAASDVIKKAGGLTMKRENAIGYFTFLLPYNSDDMLGALKSLRGRGDDNFLFSAVVYDTNSLRTAKEMTPAAEGLVATGNGREGTEHFSGLNQIKAPEFVRVAEAAIGDGSKVNGSYVKLGITDTGITYNHPSFKNASGENRISYMRDFTREGRVYFNTKAKFDVSVPTLGRAEDLVLDAEVILTPKVPSLPAGDRLTLLKDLKIKVSPELKAILTRPGSGAKFGLLLEDSISAPGELADINRNGKATDKLPVILIPSSNAAENVVYVDFTGKYDFRDAKPLHSFNITRETEAVFAEKVGFDIMDDELPAQSGRGTVKLRSVSIVGYDPGNHGSHVAGIAGGIKTLANDRDDTLARGAAPEAKILMNRVCSNNAGCSATQAIIDIAKSGQADVVNMSLGGLSQYNDGSGVQDTLVNRLTSVYNTLFVISAGNSGPGRQTVGSPSVARLSLSVGAAASRAMIERQYGWPGLGTSAGEATQATDPFMLFFSSRGPTAGGGFKPNLVAPGTELSAIQLNSSPGTRAGLDVYWGTSMSAPTATGAYALFLDAIRKYNKAHPDAVLPTDSVTLRNVLIESATPFDVTSLDLNSKESRVGQYTWIDQGTGMMDLVAAWNKLIELRDSSAKSDIRLGDQTVEPDYIVLGSIGKNPNGIAYDGSRAGAEKQPVFASGVYLDFYGKDTRREIHVARRIPEKFAQSRNAGILEHQLSTTFEDFELRTVIHGSDKEWLKVGTLATSNCLESSTARMTIIGRGAEIVTNANGTGSLSPFNPSILHVCLNRAMIENELPQGDNGALIYAYRKSVRTGQVSPVASFVIPVYLTVPHKTLAGASAYETTRKVTSFGVSRNYVNVPKGASVVRVTLSLPPAKQGCQGVELMALEGNNSARSFASRTQARVANCDETGVPSDGKRTLVLTRTNPNPGIWDLHVFGQYKYEKSEYTLRVDYVVANADIEKIEGGLPALNGSLHWMISDASLQLMPNNEKSVFALLGLQSESKAKAEKRKAVLVAGPEGSYRKYDANATSVTITTSGSPGNDIDLRVNECNESDGTPDPETCSEVGSSAGPADDEKVIFTPEAGKTYVVLVDGYEIKDDGAFVSHETIKTTAEKGTVLTTGSGPSFTIDYAFSDDAIAASKLIASPQFESGKYVLFGELSIKDADSVVLGSLPVRITK